MEHVTRIIKIRARINNNKLKEVGTAVPAEVGIREERTRRRIPGMETGRNQIL
jgi:hypothetical protein